MAALHRVHRSLLLRTRTRRLEVRRVWRVWEDVDSLLWRERRCSRSTSHFTIRNTLHRVSMVHLHCRLVGWAIGEAGLPVIWISIRYIAFHLVLLPRPHRPCRRTRDIPRLRRVQCHFPHSLSHHRALLSARARLRLASPLFRTDSTRAVLACHSRRTDWSVR